MEDLDECLRSFEGAPAAWRLSVTKQKEREDRCNCLRAIAQAVGVTADFHLAMREHLQEMFKASPGQQLLSLSSIHRAKGDEWDRVYIFQPKFLFLKFVFGSGLSWETEQEANCAPNLESDVLQSVLNCVVKLELAIANQDLSSGVK